MRPCRECGREVSEQAFACPGCGAPRPTVAKWDGHGWEWKSRAAILGLPLVHVAFKYKVNPRRPVVAKGWLAIGQFAAGVVTISQFGLGVVSLGQFTVAGWTVAQMAIAWSLLAQLGLYLGEGRGQLVVSLWRLLGIGP